jgi:hypothetical protein
MPMHQLSKGLRVTPLPEAAEQLEIGCHLHAKLTALCDEPT